ncbi:efflux RND transporter periplasmic adaptor subunit [Rhodoferax saidenbachensis]|uniref:HlyD family secretion protein n=1 Tax=Rhodoferax saidenbachensis TaxID=1484693 RepID=A0ABU1ZSX2_9BURK|nr:HlyD family secretion protein [Rhodoferax saidenbachensis]
MTVSTPEAQPTSTNARTPLRTEDVIQLLDEPASRVWWRMPTVWVGAVVLVAAVAGGLIWKGRQQASQAPSYVTETVARGHLALSVMANGTLQPTRSVSIGSELSGTVLRVLVDVNDHVKKGQVLVELDTSKLGDQVKRSRATLASAQAKLAQAVVATREARTSLARLEEVARLSGGKVPSKTELDTGRATLETAQAAELSAQAAVADAKAAAATDETNLSKASIRSPIDGVVLTRTVDPGNAVAASLQAVTLFTVAEDLGKLRLQVNVDEADVGSVQLGQKASFTVSAYPTRKFPAKVTRVAFGSTITDNVVTYITYLEVDNTDQTLRPGMTASATIAATERDDALLVPNTALRFSPLASTGGGGAAASKGGIVSSLMPRMPGGTRKAGGSGSAGAARQVWVLRDGAAGAVAVTPGISDGRMTEITAGELQVGDKVITDQRTAGARS